MTNKIFRSVSPDSLVAFRILFGLIMLWEVWRYFDRGWIHRYWVEPIDHFKYEGFFWVEPLSAGGMTALFWILGVLALFICVGFLYRISTTLLFLIFTYTFLLEQARYLNHFYLIILLSLLMIFIPAHRAGSVDAWIRPSRYRRTVPLWPLWLLRFQFGIVYLMGGVAKLNRDWLGGSPMDLWLPRRADFPVIGSLFHLPEVALLASWIALILDLLALPLLLWRRSRPYAILLLTLFHVTNDRFFSIGVFPWLMIAALTIYLPSDWPRQILRSVRSGAPQTRHALIASGLAGGGIACWFHEAFSIIPFLCGALIGVVLLFDFKTRLMERRVEKADQMAGANASRGGALYGTPATGTHSAGHRAERPAGVPSARIRAERPPGTHSAMHGTDRSPGALPAGAQFITLALGLWVLIQIALPLRHFILPGNPSWTEEGHRFAWHMKLRTKSCETRFYTVNTDRVRPDSPHPDPVRGSAHDPVYSDHSIPDLVHSGSTSDEPLLSARTDDLGHPMEIDYAGYLQPWQERKLQTRPQLIVQFARTLSAIHNDQPVYADVLCSLNGRPPERLIDPDVDLTQVRFRDIRRNEWILLPGD